MASFGAIDNRLSRKYAPKKAPALRPGESFGSYDNRMTNTFNPPPPVHPLTPGAPQPGVGAQPLEPFKPGVTPEGLAAQAARRRQHMLLTGQDEYGNQALDANGNPIVGQYEREYQNVLARTKQQRLTNAFNRDQGFRGVDASSAARGILRSGIREQDRGNVQAGYDTAEKNADATDTEALGTRDSNTNMENAGFALDNASIRQQYGQPVAEQRVQQDLVGTPAPQPATPAQPEVTWAQFRASHPSAKTTAQVAALRTAYYKRFGGG